MTAARADAVVIGSGVIGASVALELARNGRSVIVVDKGPGPGTGSTSASSAIIRFSYSTRDTILTAWEGAQIWWDWERHLGCADPDGMVRYIETGNIVFRTPDYDLVRVRDLWAEFGIPFRTISFNSRTDRWSLNVTRTVRRTNETTRWASPTPDHGPAAPPTPVTGGQKKTYNAIARYGTETS